LVTDPKATKAKVTDLLGGLNAIFGFFFEACAAFRSIQTISAADTKDADTLIYEPGNPYVLQGTQ